MKLLGGRFLGSDELRSKGLSVGDNVMIHETAILVDLDKITIGSNVRIDPFCLLSASGGSLTIGSYIHIAAQACIFAAAGVVLGDFSGLSQAVKVYSASDDYSGQTLTNPTVPKQYLTNMNAKPVHIGRHAIVGSGSVILPGANLGEGVSVGALSLVTKPLAPWGIYSGSPARRLKDRKRDLLEQEKELLGA